MSQYDTFDKYQNFTKTTAVYPDETKFAYLVLGLNGEAGEVAELFKKLIRDSDNKIDEDTLHKIILELGDCLWYITRIADELEHSLEDVANANVAKLASRIERGVVKGSGDYR